MANDNEGNGLEEKLRLVREAIAGHQRYVLTTHRDPDGDGLGAEAALAEALTQLGKEVQVLNHNPVPTQYQFLHGSENFRVFEPGDHQQLLDRSEVVMLLDAATPERTGSIGEALNRFGGFTVSIDHHLAGGWAQLDLIAPNVCATTELVHDLLQGLPLELTPTMAEALYTGIVADTLGFRTSNTTPEVHYRSARLMESGFSIERVHQALFASWPVGRLRMLGAFLSGLRTDATGKLVWGVVRLKDLDRWEATSADVEGIVEEALTVAGSEMAILFLEEPENMVRVSFRSRGGIYVDGLARSLGGGGHAQAAGTRLDGPVTTVQRRVLRAAELVLAEKD